MIKNIVFISLFFSLFLTSPAYSKQDNIDKNEEHVKVLESALYTAKIGPQSISLIDQAILHIPENYLYIPTKEASDIMRLVGNETDNNFVGLILSKDDEFRWFISVDFIKSGYISDIDAKSWNSDDLLKSLKNGTEEENRKRIRDGFSPLHVIGWIEKPIYNTSKHELIWSMLAKNDDSSEATVNYNTYALGRDGYFKFNLVTSESTILQDKLHAKKILDAVHFKNGKQYEDFVEGKDRIAEFGIAALITGAVAKKLGLFALAGALFIKMWKLLILIPILLGAKIKSLFWPNKKTVAE